MNIELCPDCGIRRIADRGLCTKCEHEMDEISHASEIKLATMTKNQIQAMCDEQKREGYTKPANWSWNSKDIMELTNEILNDDRKLTLFVGHLVSKESGYNFHFGSSVYRIGIIGTEMIRHVMKQHLMHIMMITRKTNTPVVVVVGSYVTVLDKRSKGLDALFEMEMMLMTKKSKEFGTIFEIY